MNEEKVANEDDNDEENDTLSEIIDTMPKALQLKARILTARLKKMVDWNDRGELLREGVPIPGSNITYLIHDLVRRRKTFEPVGWQHLASQLRGINIPMELVGKVARRQHIQKGEITPRKKQATAPRKKRTVSRRKTPALVLDILEFLKKLEWWSQKRHTMTRSYMVAVVIFIIFAAVVVLVILLSSSSLGKNIWCVGGIVSWGGKNDIDTTTKNESEVMAVSPRYDESYQTRTSNAGYPNRTRTPFTNWREDASNVVAWWWVVRINSGRLI